MTTASVTLPELPAAARPLLDELLGGQSLGASRNIRQINDLLCIVAEQSQGRSGDDLRALLARIGGYFIATRGRNTPAIANSIRLLLAGLEGLDAGSAADVRDALVRRRDESNARSLARAERMAEYGANLLSGATSILPFDYSSTMMAILKRLAERGERVRLIVPESRVLDGGRPIVREATGWGHSATYILDAAFAAFLPGVDAVLVGAETIQASGECWNTVGTYPLAVMADHFHVPFYVATELLKIDPLSFAGYRKPIQPHDCRALLRAEDFETQEAVSTVQPELDSTPARHITAYVTEEGVMPPGQIFASARAFLERHGIQPESLSAAGDGGSNE